MKGKYKMTARWLHIHNRVRLLTYGKGAMCSFNY